MEHDFWHERWQSNQLGFHQEAVNERLTTFWPQLQLAASATVFVPLCGKSLDMLWLAAQGHKVIGIELSQIAVDAFFDENDLSATKERVGDFNVSRSGSIEIWCGDFFQLDPSLLASADAVYDRGSLVALPADLRPDYCAKLKSELSADVKQLLALVEYDQRQMSAPPFSITEQDLIDQYGDRFSIRQVCSEEASDLSDRFRQRGLTWMRDTCYILGPRNKSKS